MNKKLMSSVLAGIMAVSTVGLSVSAAEAKDKSVTTAGSTTYKVATSVAEAEINVSVPGAMSSVINPYGIKIMVKGTEYGAQGVTSPVYTIKNNTTTSAVMVSVTPTITVPTVTDKDTKVKSTTIAVVSTAADVATKEAAKEKAIYAFVAGKESAAGSEVPVATTEPAALTIFDASGAVDSGATTAVLEDASLDEKGAVHTKYDLLLIPKALGTTANGVTTVTSYSYGQIQMGGDVTNTNITPWSKSDKLSINVVLDIAPAADNATKGTYAGGSTPGGFTAAVDASDIGGVTGAWALGALTADDTYAMTYDGNTGGNCTPTFTGYTITSATSSDTTKLTVNASGRMTGVADGTVTVTYVLENNTDSTDTPTIKFEVTLSNC